MESACDPTEAYRRYGAALRRKAERALGSGADAADIVQALFAELLRRRVATVSLSYLYCAVTRRCINLVRDRRTRERLLTMRRDDPEIAGRTRCDERVISLDLLARLGARLDRKHLEVLIGRYLDDLSQEELAELLAVSRKTVGKRLARIHAEVAALAGEGPR